MIRPAGVDLPVVMQIEQAVIYASHFSLHGLC